MKNIIEYPSLVEQAYGMLLSQGITNVSKLALFNKLVKENLLDTNGQPTKKAIKEGYIKKYRRDNMSPIKKFKYDYPRFAFLSDSCFKVDHGAIAISLRGIALYIQRLTRDEQVTEKELHEGQQLLNDWIKENKNPTQKQQRLIQNLKFELNYKLALLK